MSVLVTGGAGYLGSHVVLELAQAGVPVVVVDDLSTGDAESVARVERLTGRRVPVHIADVRDRIALRRVLGRHDVEAVVHLAGSTAGRDSIAEPLEAYENDVESTLALLRTMQSFDIRRLVLASALAARHVQDIPSYRSRVMVERIVEDLTRSGDGWHIDVLRIANVVGAHPSGIIGESTPAPSHLLPSICRVAAGWTPHLPLLGTDHPTPDGTGVRDYVHVLDVAAAFRAALRHEDGLTADGNRLRAYDVASGSGRSVHEVIDTFERVTGVQVPAVAAPARAGAAASVIGDPRAAAAWGWQPRRSLEDACRDAWRWHVGNPYGYAGVLRRRPHRTQPPVHRGTAAGARTARRMTRWAHLHR